MHVPIISDRPALAGPYPVARAALLLLVIVQMTLSYILWYEYALGSVPPHTRPLAPAPWWPPQNIPLTEHALAEHCPLVYDIESGWPGGYHEMPVFFCHVTFSGYVAKSVTVTGGYHFITTLYYSLGRRPPLRWFYEQLGPPTRMSYSKYGAYFYWRLENEESSVLLSVFMTRRWRISSVMVQEIWRPW